VCGFVEIHTQEIQKLKSTVNFIKLMGKVLYAAVDMGTGMHDANATEQRDRMHIHVDLAKDIDDNLDKFVNKFISRNQWRASPFAIVKTTDN